MKHKVQKNLAMNKLLTAMLYWWRS